MRSPKPGIGTKISCNSSMVTHLNSEVPMVRIRLVDGSWLALDSAARSGLIVFLDKDQDFDRDTLRGVQITDVGERVAFAKCLDSL